MRIRKPNFPSLLIIAILAAGLAGGTGCGGSNAGPGIQIPADPTAATQGNLESLFDQISLQIQTAKPGSDNAVQLQNQLATVGAELAERASATARTRLSEVDRVDGKLPLGAIEREVEALRSVKRWDVTVFTKINNELTGELEATRRAIKERENRLATISDRDVLDRINLLYELSALSGTGSEKQARYAQQRDEILRNVV